MSVTLMLTLDDETKRELYQQANALAIPPERLLQNLTRQYVSLDREIRHWLASTPLNEGTPASAAIVSAWLAAGVSTVQHVASRGDAGTTKRFQDLIDCVIGLTVALETASSGAEDELLPADVRAALLRQYTAPLTPEQQEERNAWERISEATVRALATEMPAWRMDPAQRDE